MSLLCSVAQTQSHSDESTFDDSLNKTQDFLKNRSERNEAISESQDAQKADSQVKKLAPDAKTQDEYYELSAEILNNYREAKDEAAMKRDISNAKTDPVSFYNRLTPEQKEKIKKLSEKLNPGAQTNP